MLPVTYASEWRTVSIVQVAFFAVILITFLTGMFLRIFRVDATLRKNLFIVTFFFTMFSSFKIGGGICAIIQVDQDKPSTGLMIATYILDTASLGFLLKSIVNYLDYMMFPRPSSSSNGGILGIFNKGGNSDFQEVRIGLSNRKDSESSTEDMRPTDPKKDLSKFHPFRVTTVVIMVAIILSIVGACEMSDGSSGGSTGTYFKVSSLLFLAALILVFGLLVYIYFQQPTFRSGIRIIMFSLVFYLVRIIYSIVSSFTGINISSTSFNKFTLIFGDYKYYTFMGFLMESLIAIMLFIFSQWFLTRNPTHF